MNHRDPTVVTVASVLEEQEPRPNLDDLRITCRQAAAEGTQWLADNLPYRWGAAVADHRDVRAWVRQVIFEAAATPNGTVPAPTPGPSLAISGVVGVGKTHQAWGAVRAIAVSGVAATIVVATAADIYGSLRPRTGVDSEEEFAKYCKAGLLLIDDLGAAKHSDWTEEVNYRLINYRHERGKRTILTSNVPHAEFGVQLGLRVASRLREMCRVVTLAGPDRRSKP